ncbi:hypothetical protein [Niabella aurantiaca]|uniref:hypothetical protein n=1 Tax=Niabella aurantiaca TaxID=379900 RepID=UPI000372E8F4|nr:hypothetical protein [Niabella aurantiaca]
MNRKRFSVLLLCCFFLPAVRAQNPTLIINSDNISGEVSTSNASFTANSCLLALGAKIQVQANADFSPALNPSILSKIKLLVTAIGPNISLGGSATEQPLSTSSQPLYSALLTLLSSGGVTIRYRIPQTEMVHYAWKAGTYTTNLSFTTPGGTLCLGTSTYPASLSVVVTPFINFPVPSGPTLTVNDLNYFRTATLSGSTILPSVYTVPLGLRVKTGAANFAYSDGYPGATNPNTGTDQVSAKIPAPVPGPAIALNTTYQDLSPAGGFAVPEGNTQNNTVSYTISPANLKAGFIQKGTYTVPLYFEAFDAGTVPQVSTIAQPSALTVNVEDMGELLVHNNEASLSFSDINDYTNGVSTSIANALTISKTTPYDVYVRSSSPSLASGSNTIPVGCIAIGPGNGDPSVSTISLSAVSQKIISAAAPVIDRQVALQYSIGPDKVEQVLGKPPGTYTTTVTYSFVAL